MKTQKLLYNNSTDFNIKNNNRNNNEYNFQVKSNKYY